MLSARLAHCSSSFLNTNRCSFPHIPPCLMHALHHADSLDIQAQRMLTMIMGYSSTSSFVNSSMANI
eukprot:5669195-Amphidinium_carterae.1